MRTHLSFNGYCVRAMWRGEAPYGAVRCGTGRLVNPNGNYVDAPYVTVFYSPTDGYGYGE